MNSKNLLLTYAKYNLWANERICGFLEKLEPALLDREIPSSFNTLRKTIYHIWDAEYIWYERLHEKSPTENEVPSVNSPSTKEEDKGVVLVSDFKAPFLSQSHLFIPYIESLTEEDLNEEFDYKNIEGKPFRNKRIYSVHHLFNHSPYHRGQIITMLRNAGYTDLSSTDFITYIRENL